MTDGKQELDEIFTDESAKAKQAVIDWHNKQIEEVLDRLDKYLKDEISIRPRNAIQAERNKLKESK